MKCKESLLTDINDLCESCFLREKINSVKANMIRKYEFVERNNTVEFVENFLRQKIEIANQKIENIFNFENTSSAVFRENRVGLLISWKDCLKYYSDKLIELNNTSSPDIPEPMPLQPKRRVHINAIENEINWLFSERIKQSEALASDAFLEGIQCIDGINYVFRKINRRDKEALKRLAKIKLTEYLADHPDNTLELFQTVTIERAEGRQSYYPNYKTDNQQKEVFFALQRWIETVESLSPKKITEASFTAPPKFYKEGDFDAIINDLLEIEWIQVENLLDHHYELASKPKSMGASNWVVMLHKQLRTRFPYSSDGQPSTEEHFNIGTADLWIKNKLSDLVQKTHERTNKPKENGDAPTKGKLQENPYPRIFKNHESYLLFERLKDTVRERCQLADYSFIYARMKKDGYIFANIKDSEFREFLQNFSVEIEKMKLLDYSKTPLKETNYIATKGLFKNL